MKLAQISAPNQPKVPDLSSKPAHNPSSQFSNSPNSSSQPAQIPDPSSKPAQIPAPNPPKSHLPVLVPAGRCPPPAPQPWVGHTVVLGELSRTPGTPAPWRPLPHPSWEIDSCHSAASPRVDEYSCCQLCCVPSCGFLGVVIHETPGKVPTGLARGSSNTGTSHHKHQPAPQCQHISVHGCALGKLRHGAGQGRPKATARSTNSCRGQTAAGSASLMLQRV